MKALTKIDKFRWILIAAVAAFLLMAIMAVQFYQQPSTKSANEVKKEGTASVNVNVENDEKTTSETNSTTPNNPSNTCTVTKNGVTKVVPADEVNISEKSSDDVSVKVDCKSSSSTSNGSSTNNSSVKTDIKVETNTSN